MTLVQACIALAIQDAVYGKGKLRIEAKAWLHDTADITLPDKIPVVSAKNYRKTVNSIHRRVNAKKKQEGE